MARIPLLIVGLFALVAVFGTACAQPPASPPKPEALYAEMAHRTSEVMSLHISSKTLKPPGTTVGEIDIAKPNKFKFYVEFQSEEEGSILIARGVSVSGSSFVKYSPIKGWFPEAEGAFTNLNNLLSVITQDVSDLTFISREKVGGAGTVHIRGNLDEEAVQKFEPGFTETAARVDMWIKESDPVLIRIKLELFESSGSFAAWLPTVDMTVSRINKTVQIERPPQAEINHGYASNDEDFEVDFDLPEEDLRAIFRLVPVIRDRDPRPSGWPFRGVPVSPVQLAMMRWAAENYNEQTGIDLMEDWN